MQRPAGLTAMSVKAMEDAKCNFVLSHTGPKGRTKCNPLSRKINSDGGGKSGEGRGGVKLREGSQTPMVAGEGRGGVKLREGS